MILSASDARLGRAVLCSSHDLAHPGRRSRAIARFPLSLYVVATSLGCVALRGVVVLPVELRVIGHDTGLVWSPSLRPPRHAANVEYPAGDEDEYRAAGSLDTPRLAP